MISIFDYIDYREFLRDFYHDKKKNSPFFSYRFIGTRVGMDSSYVIKVLQGLLHISKNKIDKFVKLCSFNEQESRYFETLVHFNKSKSKEERKIYFEQLFAISKVKSHRIEPFQYEFFQKWYYSAVWALISCSPFLGSIDDLARQCSPQITVHQAKAAIKLLLRMGLVCQKPDGSYEVTDKNITTGEKWCSDAIAQYQQEMVHLAGESLARFKKSERDISTVTITINQNAISEVRSMITEFRRSLVNLADSMDTPDRVFQLNVQFFPLTADVSQPGSHEPGGFEAQI